MAARRSVQTLLNKFCKGGRSFSAVPQGSSSTSSISSSQHLINLEYEHSAHNYHPIPVVFSQAKGACIWDPEGRKYLDFLSAYSAVNQGHCHPKVMKALAEQAGRLTLSSRAFYNDKFPVFAELLTSIFGYDMVLPMNTGAEGVETALKLARKWGYEKKKIPNGEAIIISCCGCFHGRTLAVISMSCDNDATRGFGPLLPGHRKVDFGDVNALETILNEHGDRVAGFLFEPIQGEAGVIIPPDDYLKAVRDLCSKHNVLMIADEIQTGIARTGRMLACDWEDVRPDVVILGKALGAGVIPVSVVLANKDVMLSIQPGQHGRADQMGQEFRHLLGKIQLKFPDVIKEIRGRGLLNAVELSNKALFPVSAYDICLQLKERGILAKPTHDNIIRLAPPLCISTEEIQEASKAFSDALEFDLPKLRKQKPDTDSPPVSQVCDRCGRNTY
ncbi:Ornithine aminotransferase protein [Thalictrum thalictroides]|uniref:Ornithine aminotransferase n=1 Tax=Thalictrum thalictroides TaxID=46969 RepID=A0A7J6V1G2_THATH|nr:Ornithine aminotransferase protein [Thalictrum thalictroides]